MRLPVGRCGDGDDDGGGGIGFGVNGRGGGGGEIDDGCTGAGFERLPDVGNADRWHLGFDLFGASIKCSIVWRK